ncbi:Helix-turn-helix domain protein [Mycobacteroides salmoniphilum]|uniref:Helix-turn-helix domain protein n=1 Tax=Mycobacteroides salmoniphilum TaxID=404941 RepID=A0A4V3HY64_9MYCO|nr:helix-turn-helix domain-containing protein [Mycobacteroides salmoniphilum]TDZ80088.1 Helix-turn-helix domain protein [Mycobacteroides salmoniphilum]
MSTELLLSTGEVAGRLGVSRQHVVDLCTRGKLPFTTVGTHRRIPESAVNAMASGGRDRSLDGHEQSLALHALVVSKLLGDPERVLAIARRNAERDRELGNAHSEKYTREWSQLLKQDIRSLIDAMLDSSAHGVTLRSCTPFTGILSAQEVQTVKRQYQGSRISALVT